MGSNVPPPRVLPTFSPVHPSGTGDFHGSHRFAVHIRAGDRRRRSLWGREAGTGRIGQDRGDWAEARVFERISFRAYALPALQ